MHKLSSSQKIFSFFFHIGGFPLFTTTTGSLYAQPEKRPGKSAQRQLTHCFSSSLKFSSIPKKWFFKLQHNLSLSPARGCDRTRKNASRRVRKKCTSLSLSPSSIPALGFYWRVSLPPIFSPWQVHRPVRDFLRRGKDCFRLIFLGDFNLYTPVTLALQSSFLMVILTISNSFSLTPSFQNSGSVLRK